MSSPSLSLRSVQLLVPWPEEIPLSALRGWIRQQLLSGGEPLRWAITAIEKDGDIRQIRLEAVLLG